MKVSTASNDERGLALPKRSGTQAVERALAVLRCFESSVELGVGEIASQLQLSLATTSRIVRALRTGGILGQDGVTERYHLGIGVAMLGRLANDRLGFTSARTELESLSERTGESAFLGVRSGPEVLVLLSVPSKRALRYDERSGSRNPIHACAMGKVLLAFGDEPLPKGWRLERYTPRTITTLSLLDAETMKVRSNGWAVNDEERTLGVRAIGVPVRYGAGVVAAIAIQGPTVRLVDNRIEELAIETQRTASRLALAGHPVLKGPETARIGLDSPNVP